MASFEHTLLTDMKSDERWLKYFPRKVFVSGAIKIFVAILIIYLFGISPATLIITSIIVLWAIAWALLSIIEKSPKKYLNGGGMKLTDLFFKKRYFQKHTCDYVLGINKKLESEKIAAEQE